MHDLVARAVALAPQHIQARRAQPVQQLALGYRTVRRAATIRGLVQAIDGDGVMGGRALEPAPPVGKLLRVDVPSRIDDQRRPASGNLDVEQVIMAVTAVAQRATVEDEIAFFLEWCGSRSPAAALDKVATLRKTTVFYRRRIAASPGRPDV